MSVDPHHMATLMMILRSPDLPTNSCLLFPKDALLNRAPVTDAGLNREAKKKDKHIHATSRGRSLTPPYEDS